MSVQGLRLATGEHKHTPNEVTAFTMSFANALVDGETLTTEDVAGRQIVVDGATASPIVIDSVQIVTPVLNIVISSGIAGGVYRVVARVNTNLGQKLEGAVTVVTDDAVET